MLGTQEIFEALNLLRQEYKCPISLQIMQNPVVDCQGISYQKANIEKWLQTNTVSPITGNVLHSKSLIPNNYLGNLIKKVEIQIPLLFSFIQVLNTQINHLNLQNKRLESERELNFVSSQISESQNNEGKKIEQMVHEEAKIKDQQNDKQQLKSDEINTEKEQQKVNKTKLIKKVKLERFYDSKMSENMKQANRNWEKHLENLKMQQTQITNKLSESLKMKEEIIEKSKQTINEQSSKISELSRMVDESQNAPNSILSKIEDLSKEVMGVINKNLTQYPEHIKEKYSYQLMGVQDRQKNQQQINNPHAEDRINPNSQFTSNQKPFYPSLPGEREVIIGTPNVKIEEYRQRFRQIQRDALIELQSTKKNSYQIKLNKLVAENEGQRNMIKLLEQKVKERNIASTINLNLEKSPKKKDQQNQTFMEVEYWQMIFQRQFKQNHQNWMLIIYAYEYFISQILTYEEFALQQIQNQKQAQEQKLTLQNADKESQKEIMQRQNMQEQKQKQIQQDQRLCLEQSQPQNQNKSQKQVEKFKLFTLMIQFIRKKKQEYENYGLLGAFESIIQAQQSHKNYFSRAINCYKKIQWSLTSSERIPTNFLFSLEPYKDGVARGFGCGYKISFEVLRRILVDLKETVTIWKELMCIYSDIQYIKKDKVWELLVHFRYLFPNLLQIRLPKCSIQCIQGEDFSRWPLLSKIDLSDNPLTEKSNMKLLQYRIKNPRVKVIL